MIESKETNKKLKVKEFWVMKREIREFRKRREKETKKQEIFR